jgi:hypothetical protein
MLSSYRIEEAMLPSPGGALASWYPQFEQKGGPSSVGDISPPQFGHVGLGIVPEP